MVGQRRRLLDYLKTSTTRATTSLIDASGLQALIAAANMKHRPGMAGAVPGRSALRMGRNANGWPDNDRLPAGDCRIGRHSRKEGKTDVQRTSQGNQLGRAQARPRDRARSRARPTAPCWRPTARRRCCAPRSRRRQPKPGIDFFPLTVNYQEKTFAAGKIPGGFFKREGRPTEKETLTSRLIDRPIRPLFADGFRNETQVICTVLSHDLENDPDIVAMVGASAALTISGIPFLGPIGGARVGYIDGEYVLNPTADQMPRSALDLVVAGTARGRADGRVRGEGAVARRSCSAPSCSAIAASSR